MSYHHVLLRLASRLPAWMALLGPLVALAQTPADPYSYSRKVALERDPVTGWVTAEIQQPDDPQLCLRTEFAYDNFGNKRQTTQRHCATTMGVAQITTRITTMEHNAEGAIPAGLAPTVVTNAEQHQERRQIDTRYGGVQRVQDANGLVTQIVYDDFGRKILEIRPDGNRTAWDYALCVNVGGPASCPSQADAGGALVTYRVQTRPQNSASQPNGPMTTTYFDTEGREVRTDSQAYALGGMRTAIVLHEYDTLGRKLRQTGPYFDGDTPAERVEWQYDNLGRVVVESRANPNAANGTTQKTTEYRGRIVVHTNALGNTLTKEHDEHGRVIRVTDAQGNQISYQHDAFGNLAVVRDPMGNVTRMGYDLRGQKVSMEDPDMGNWVYRYDVLGQLKEQTNPKGQTASITYDRLGRMTQRLEADLDSRWFFDRFFQNAAWVSCGASVGALCEATTTSGYRRLNTYDSLGRLTKSATTLASGPNGVYVSKVSYDANGRIDQQVWPTGLGARYVYNTEGELVEVRNAATSALYWQRNENNARGDLVSATMGNGVIQRTTWQPETGLATAMRVGPASSPAGVVNHAYEYNALHNMVLRMDANTAVSETFQYDRLNRLTRQNLSGPAGNRGVAYYYDALGNITYNSDAGVYDYTPEAGQTPLRPRAVRRVTGYAGKLTNPVYRYDANGNLLSVTGSNGIVRTHTWTSFDMPERLALSERGVSSTFLYGPEHQRIRQVVVRDGQSRAVHYLHPDKEGTLYFERDEVGTGGVATNRHFLNAGGGVFLQLETPGALQAEPVATDLPGVQLRYWHKDHLGSVAAITESTGAVMERLAYEPFGKRRYPDGRHDAGGDVDAVRTKRGFTGHEHLDEVDYVHMNARVYDPDIGRFLSPDPTVPHPLDLQGFNRYSYTRNNPLNFWDPSGFDDDGLGAQAASGDESKGQGNDGATQTQDGVPSVTTPGQSSSASAAGPEPGPQPPAASGFDLADWFWSTLEKVSNNLNAFGPYGGFAAMGIKGFVFSARVAKTTTNATEATVAAAKAAAAKAAAATKAAAEAEAAKVALAAKATKPTTLKPGPFAKESIPGHRGKPTAGEQKQVNALMEKNGCHTCGTKNPGTKSGNAVVDHQPAQALGETVEFFPHCLDCMRRQGGEVLQEVLKRTSN